MGKQTKATKKFEKKHLKDVVDRRKEFAKIKQRHQLKDKKKQRAAQKDEQQSKQTTQNGTDKNSNEAAEAADMDRDAFFQDTVPAPLNKPDVTTKSKIGKRKRGDEDQEQREAFTAASDAEKSDDDDFGLHAKQLETLAKSDPEFYKYLQEEDAELLDFNDDDDDLGEIGSDEDETLPSSGQKNKRHAEMTASVSDLTSNMITKWRNSMQEQYSVRAMREIVLAFRAAAHTNDADEKNYKYSIPNSDIYHDVMVTTLKEVPAVLAHHIPVKESAAGRIRVATDSPKFKTLSTLIKSHASSLQYLLGNLTDTATLRLTLQSFEPLLPYLLQFRKLMKVITKSIAAIWSDNSSDEATRVTAFLVLRKLMVIGDAGVRETVLSSTYEGIVKGCRNTTIYTLNGINLMKNSAAEIWGLDTKVSYTTGFTFIRQLAIHLRSNITKPTKDSYKTIYNWQFVHSLDFWSRVLSLHCNSLLEAQNGKMSELRPLIYPVVQITLGVMRLIPTSTYFPLRFQLIRSLLRISQSTGTYIPLAAAFLEVLNSAEMRKPAKGSMLKALDFTSSIRAPSSYTKTKVYQDGVGEQVVELLGEFLALWSKSIAYPELQLPLNVMLKRWLKTASKTSTGNKNGKLNQSILLLVQKSETNAKWIEEKRNKVTFTPKDRTEVEAFLKDVAWEDTPLGAFIAGQRRLRADRAKVLEEGRREEERRRTQQRRKEDNGDLV